MNKQILQREVENGEDRLPEALHPVLRRIYRARGVMHAHELDSSLTVLLAPGDLLGMDRAVQLLSDALREQQSILVVGDFDVDGATSCAVAIRALKEMGAQRVSYLVPDRIRHGYGLTAEIVTEALALSPDLIITVDNGISSGEGVAAAKQQGIKVLITDHHLPGSELPAADAIVNPNQAQDGFASKALAGVGVVFYVMMALRARLRELGWFDKTGIAEPNLARLLDLVALGTVADLVPLDRNNRVLVAQGLARINAGETVPGILALLAMADKRPGQLTASDLGFFVAPRLNAAGRLEDMSLGIECLLSESPQTAHRLAGELDRINRERRDIQADMQEQAMQAVRELDLGDAGLSMALCLFNPGWHQGVVGLVASKIKDQYHRPVIAFAPAGDNQLKGSARSIPGLHIRDTLDTVAARHPDLLSKFGGHAMAAGLTIEERHLQAFIAAFNQEVARLISETDLGEIILTDGTLESSDMGMDFAETLRAAGPWGQSFPEPLFSGVFQVRDSRVVGRNHVKMRLQADGGMLDAISFNQAQGGVAPDWPVIQAAFRLDINEYRGMRSLQLLIDYMEPCPQGGEVLN